MTAEIGRVLGGRYRLVAPIGLGASAQVYLADDVKLRRRVALKMLHDALAGDAEFSRRFRAEARAAAALSHPNVMAVYDWGDGDVAFIVTEYLPGGSLRALLDGGQQLSPAQALGVGLEAARALDYAHRRGFVHRDVKPANLLFGEDQRLRIADFGLARALAEAAWTEPQGAMLGTARYAAPEQAKGEVLSGKADVYALALVLVEAVTGEVPFVADTTLGTLMARVGKPLVVPEALGPLQAILTRAGHPDPERRIDARTLAGGLLRAARELSRPEPLPLVGALVAGGDLAEDPDPTVHGPEAAAEAEAEAAVTDLTSDDLELEPPHWVNQAAAAVAAGAAVPPADVDAEVPLAAPTPGPEIVDAHDGRGDVAVDPEGTGGAPVGDAPADPSADDEPLAADAVADEDAPAEEDAAGPAEEADPERIDGGPAVAALVGGAAGAAAAGAAGAGDDQVVDLTDAAVASPAWADGGDATVVDPADRVVVPAPVDAPTEARPLVAPPGAPPVGPPDDRPTGPLPVTVPPVPADVPSDDGDAPDGRRRRRWPWVLLVFLLVAGAGGGAAAVVASRDEPEPVPVVPVDLPVPTLVGLTEQDARTVAEAAGWTVAVELVRFDGTTAGDVLATAPAAGVRLDDGGELRLTVSEGQLLHALPADLVGATVEDAQAALAEVDLLGAVSSEVFDEDAAAGVVLSLAEGTPAELETGGTVQLVVSKGPEPRTVPSGLRGSTQAEATAALEAVQLGVAVTESFSDDVAAGIVISVLPAEGSSQPRGDVITLEVSKGPELVAVPSVTSAEDLDEAVAILNAAGFVDGDVSGPARGTPTGTSPAAGTMVRPGSTIDIVLGRPNSD